MYSYGPPTYGRAKAGRPARTYIQQLCEDTGYNPEDLPEAMSDRREGEWRERVRDIRAGWHDMMMMMIFIIVLFCVFPSLEVFLYKVMYVAFMSNTNNLYTIILFHVFLSNNYMVSSNSYQILIII